MAKQGMAQRGGKAKAAEPGGGKRVAGPRAAQLAAAAAALGRGAVQGAGLKKKEPLQGAGLKKKEPLQGAGLKKKDPLQKAAIDDEDEPVQRAAKPGGLPEGLKTGVEALSGMSMDHVRVHYDSARPAQLGAHAFAQGSDIHVAPGQARHLPHEAWHVVQQAQGRVRPTMQLKEGVPVNDDAALEREADAMGAKAMAGGVGIAVAARPQATAAAAPVQRAVHLDLEGTPQPTDIVHVIKIDRLATPDTVKLSGEDSKSPAARHIIPWALIEREFKSRYNGLSVQTLATDFNVAIGPDFMIDLATSMQKALLYENRQLNEGGGPGTRPDGATKDKHRYLLETPSLAKTGYMKGTDQKNQRNYWEGAQSANLAKDTLATIKLANLSTEWSLHFGAFLPSKVKATDPKWKTWRAKFGDEMREALGEEFDPPPFASKDVIKRAAKEWARMTNNWLDNDKVARAYYWPGSPIVWTDAVSWGDNALVYNSAP